MIHTPGAPWSNLEPPEDHHWLVEGRVGLSRQVALRHPVHLYGVERHHCVDSGVGIGIWDAPGFGARRGVAGGPEGGDEIEEKVPDGASCWSPLLTCSLEQHLHAWRAAVVLKTSESWDGFGLLRRRRC